MQAWKETFSVENLKYDISNLIVGVFSNLIGYNKIDDSFSTLSKFRAWFYLSAVSLQQIFLFWIVHRHRRFFNQNRENLLVSIIISRILLYYTCVLSCPEIFNTILRLQYSGTTNLGIVNFRQWLFVPLILARTTMSQFIPFDSAKYIFLTAIPVALYVNISRCATEVTTLAGQGVVYRNLVQAAEKIIFRWVPFLPFSASGDCVRAAQLTEIGACIAVKNTPVVVLGYFVPMVLLYTEEVKSRKKFVQERRLGTAFSYSSAIHLLLHSLLLPFQTAVTFHAIVYLAWLARGWL